MIGLAVLGYFVVALLATFLLAAFDTAFNAEKDFHIAVFWPVTLVLCIVWAAEIAGKWFGKKLGVRK